MPDAQARLELALAFAFTVRGLPILYYGTEQGFSDCNVNRQDLFGRYDTTHPLYAWVKQLNQIRSRSAALRLGAQEERWQDDTAYAFERESGASAAVVAFNFAASPRTLTLHHLHAPVGTVLTDALGSGAFTIDASRNLTLEVPGKGVVILTH